MPVRTRKLLVVLRNATILTEPDALARLSWFSEHPAFSGAILALKTTDAGHVLSICIRFKADNGNGVRTTIVPGFVASIVTATGFEMASSTFDFDLRNTAEELVSATDAVWTTGLPSLEEAMTLLTRTSGRPPHAGMFRELLLHWGPLAYGHSARSVRLASFCGPGRAGCPCRGCVSVGPARRGRRSGFCSSAGPARHGRSCGSRGCGVLS
jgi:hypothetical protein